jgi:uncharacterized membrane protein YhhN
MPTVLLVLTLALAAADWAAAENKWRRLHLVFKPATLLALIAWFSLAAGWGSGNTWFGLALVCSLLGDIILLFPGRFFVLGLAAFLLAHLAYVIGFNQAPLALNYLALVPLAGLVCGDIFVVRLLRPGLARIEGGRGMLLPMVAYGIIISLMAISAWLCLFRPAWPANAALAAGVGALLFFCSDSLLVYNRIVRQTPHRDLWVLSAYHLGQVGIIAGVILAGLS